MSEICSEFPMDAYLDDELSGAKKAAADAHLAVCPACQKTLEALMIQGQVLREEMQAAAEKVDFSGFEERVMTRIGQEQPPSAGERFWYWLRGVVVHYRTVWVTSLVTAAIVVAVLIPVLGSQTAVPEETDPGSVGSASRVAQVDNEVIIDSMEYAGQRSMVFTVSKNNTTVIWLYDFEGAKEQATGGDEL
jgi:anti-sigma factor RsiW